MSTNKEKERGFNGSDLPMEKFLLDLTEGFKYCADLERRFDAGPLPEENRNAIIHRLRHYLAECDFHAICKYYGIDVGPDPTSRSKRPNMHLYGRAVKKLRQNICTFYYLSFAPEELYSEISHLQEELRDDFERREGENYGLQWALYCAKKAYREITEANESLLEDISVDTRSRRFLIERRASEICIFFRTSQLSPNEKEVLETINALVFANHCSGGDLKRLLKGEVRIYFNPTCHDYKNRKYAIKTVVEALKKPNPDATL